jgi:hypothetical protein
MHKPNRTALIPLILNVKNICKDTKVTERSYNPHTPSDRIENSYRMKERTKLLFSLVISLLEKGDAQNKDFIQFSSNSDPLSLKLAS